MYIICIQQIYATNERQIALQMALENGREFLLTQARYSPLRPKLPAGKSDASPCERSCQRTKMI